MRVPIDCEAEYHPDFMPQEESTALFDFICKTCDLTNRKVKTVDGQTFTLDTGGCMFVDAGLTDYDCLPEVLGPRMEWPPLVRALKDKIECVTGKAFHVCVGIFYPSGGAGADFHTDYPAYGPVSYIASVSLGEEREFVFRNKNNHDDRYGLVLKNGSLLIMGEGCQERYEHALPIDEKYKNPRINLTFRRYGWN